MGTISHYEREGEETYTVDTPNLLHTEHRPHFGKIAQILKELQLWSIKIIQKKENV